MAGTRLELTPRGRAALARPSYPAVGALWDRWRASVSQDEFARVEAIGGQRRSGTLTPLASRRAAVAAGLSALEPGVWVDVDAFFAVLRTQAAPLAVTAGPLARWRLYLEDPRHGSLGPAGWKAWDIVEGRYALCVLFEYAATLGVVDVAYTGPRGARRDYRGLRGADQRDSLSRYDGLAAVRVSEVGAAILHDPGTLDALRLPRPRDPLGGMMRRIWLWLPCGLPGAGPGGRYGGDRRAAACRRVTRRRGSGGGRTAGRSRCQVSAPYSMPRLGGAYGGYIGMTGNWALLAGLQRPGALHRLLRG